MYFFAQLSNYSVQCGAEFPADICSISIKALYFQVISDGRQYNFHLPRNLLPEVLLEISIFSLLFSLPFWHTHTNTHHHHPHHPLFATHPHAETTIISICIPPHPPIGQDPGLWSSEVVGKYLPRLRTVFNFRMTCYGSSRFDSGLHCSNVWMHEEKLLWKISSDVQKHIKT